jgi:hypothetical protein
MVRKSTQRSTRRVRKVGGADTCITALLKVLPDEGDFERMVDQDCSAINTNSYDAFVNFQRAAASRLNAADCAFLLGLCQRVKGNHIAQMDLESCAVFETSYVFIGVNGKIVVVNPR